MTFKRRLYLVLFVLFISVAELPVLGYFSNKVLEAADVSSKQHTLPASVPARSHLHLISILPLIVEGDVVGRVSVFDDSTTQRSADYVEFYNKTGDLVAVSWFDNYGIVRMVVDRGLLEARDKLEGVFAFVLVGESV